MAPKKKAPEASAGGDVEENDISCETFFRLYKKTALAMEVPVQPEIKQLYDNDWVENQKPIAKVHIPTELGWQGTRAIFETMLHIKYKHCTSIRLWKGKCEDEGVRLICLYVLINLNCAILELMNCEITPLGCEFINKVLDPQQGAKLSIIKLDYNMKIGNEGVKILSENLARNKGLTMLSLAYCGFDAEGARSVFDFLIYSQSTLEHVNLSGNHIGNDGIIWIFKGLACAKTITKVVLCDGNWEDTEAVFEAMLNCFTTNKTLAKYDFKFNEFSMDGVETLSTEIIPAATHVQDVEISGIITEEAREALKTALAANKPKKGGRGKGKKKKK